MAWRGQQIRYFGLPGTGSPESRTDGGSLGASLEDLGTISGPKSGPRDPKNEISRVENSFVGPIIQPCHTAKPDRAHFVKKCRRRPPTGPARPPFAQPPREGRRPRPNFTSPTQQHRGIPTKGAAHHSPLTCRSWSQRTAAFCQNGNTARPTRPSRGPPGAILGPPLAFRGGNFSRLC